MKKIDIAFLLIVSFCAFLSSCSSDETNTEEIEVMPPMIAVADTSVTETNLNFVLELPVVLSKPTNEVVILNYSTEEGTAESNKDYTAIDNGQLIFLAGETTKIIEITIRGEQFVEDDEVFFVSFSQAANATIVDDRVAITIKTDDEDNNSAGVLNIPTTGYSTPEAYDNMILSWSDEFNGSAINRNDWKFEIGDGCPNLCGWGNVELQYYTEENASIVDGNLVIEAKKESKGGKFYTSTRMITKGLQSFKYGRVDIRASLPYGQGLWPALWMLGENIDEVSWPRCGEIDIVELIGGAGRDNEVHGTVHFQNGENNYQFIGNGYQLSSGIFNDNFHVFSIVWTENQIEWFVDDVKYSTFALNATSRAEFQQKFFFIFNIAVGGNWPGNPTVSSVLPQYMVVDYVRVFQPE